MMIVGIIAGSYIMLPYNVVLYTLAAFLILALVSYKRLLLRYIFIYVSVFLLGAILYYNAVKEYSLKNESRQNFNAVITSSPRMLSSRHLQVHMARLCVAILS